MAFRCDGQLSVNTQGEASCLGTWIEAPSVIPEIEPAQAVSLVESVALIWAVAWVLVQLRKTVK